MSAASCHFSKEASKLDPGSGKTWSTEREIQYLLPRLHAVQISSVPVSKKPSSVLAKKAALGTVCVQMVTLGC